MGQLFLHIGLPKTGTSTIQKVCARNRDLLRTRHGIRYADFARNHSDALCLMFHQRAEKAPSLITKGYTTKSKLEEGRETAKGQLTTFFRNGAGDTLLLSAENASSLKRSRIQRLAHFLDSQDVSMAKVICYVREPVSFATSLAQQRLRANATFESLLRNPPMPKFRERIEPWLDIFGKDRLEIRVFDEAVKSQNGIVGDFLNTIGADEQAADFELSDTHRNTSLSMEAAMIVDAVNQVRPLITEGQVTPGRARLDVARIFVDLPGSKFSLGAEFEDMVREESRADVAWLEDLMGRGDIFPDTCSVERKAEWSPEMRQQLGLKIFELHAENQSLKAEKAAAQAKRRKPNRNALSARLQALRRTLRQSKG